MKIKSFLTIAVALTVCIAYGQKSYYYQNGDGAMKGYDPVAYFNESSPKKGLPEYTLEWKKVEWHFSSEENLNLFKKNPKMFAPQYGGLLRICSRERIYREG